MKKTTFLSVLLMAMLTFNATNFTSAQIPACLPYNATDPCNYISTPPIGKISTCELAYVPMPPQLKIWLGSVDNNWFNANNWYLLAPPMLNTDDVWIPSGLNNYPTINGPAVCHNIWIRDGASILGNAFLTITGLAYVERLVNHIEPTQHLFAHCNWLDESVPITAPCDIHYLSSPVPHAMDSTVEQDAVWQWYETTQNWLWKHHSCDVACLGPPWIWTPGTGYSVTANQYWWCNTTDCPIYLNPPGFCQKAWKCQFYREWIGTNLSSGDINYENDPATNPPLSITLPPPGMYLPGWHLLGNPYPSAIDWGAVFTINVLVNSACMWDDLGQVYINVNGQTMVGFIPIIQGFMVQADPNFAGGWVTFTEAARLHNNNQPLNKSLRSNFLTIKVSSEVNSYKDETYLHINPEAGNNMDRLDGCKLDNGPTAPMIYSVLPDETPLAFNSLNSTETSPTVQIHFKPGVNGTHTLQVTGIESFSGNTPIFIEDRLLNVSQDIRENPVYTFNANTTDDNARFILHFTPLGINDYHYGDINIYSYNQNIFIDLPVNINGTANVFNLLGKEIISVPMTTGKLNKITVPGSSGYYVVRVVSSGNVITQKVFIN